jgi:hypothetical protein
MKTTRYEITVGGRLSDTVAAAFDGLTAIHTPAGTVLGGDVRDQAALFGLLEQIESLGLELVGVRRA